MTEFKFIESGYSDPIIKTKAPEFINIPPREHNENDIENRVSKTVKKQFLPEDKPPAIKDEIVKITNPDSVENLMGGCVNLVNILIARHKDEEPVNTLLFLDKSARNGAYIFRLVWHELEQRGELPDGINMPNIRFMDVGQNNDRKYHFPGPKEILKAKYKKNDFENQRVLVVDEYIYSGDSLRSGLKVIEDIYGVKPAGLSLFSRLPLWYGKDNGILGVTDLETKDESYQRVEDTLDRLSPDKIIGLYEATTKTEKSDFLNTMSKVISLSGFSDFGFIYQTVRRDTNTKLQINDIKSLYKSVKGTLLLSKDSQNIWQYIDSAGGFISRRLNTKQKNENNILYRKTLKAIVSSYMSERDTVKK